jgi:glycerol-3-phosphate dehydrogenase
MVNARAAHWDYAGQQTFDVLVIGGGVNGARLYSELCSYGYRTLLVDKSDFGSGSSQASGMMVWGGLLYLRFGDVLTAMRLSRARDRMIAKLETWTKPTYYRYIPPRKGGLPSVLIGAGLGFYWLLGAGQRRPPSYERHFDEAALIRQDAHRGAFRYEEAVLRSSDARLTLHWITAHIPPAGAALNYCELISVDYDRQDRLWRVELRDRLGGASTLARARLIVNCAGIWVDQVNAQFGIKSPYQHVLSKGVYLGLAREEGHQTPLIFDMGLNSDVLTYVPWGPIALWGPTETAIGTIDEGIAPDEADLRFLVESANRHLSREVRAKDIVSLRCGIRPLAVKRGYHADRYPLKLSRRSVVSPDRERPWVSVYGGKLTGCRELAARIRRVIASRISPSLSASRPCEAVGQNVECINFPGIDQPLPSPKWCREHEFCCSLQDYLRRRTNIAQWLPRHGLGYDNSNREAILALAKVFHGCNAESVLGCYEQEVSAQHDRLLLNLDMSR